MGKKGPRIATDFVTNLRGIPITRRQMKNFFNRIRLRTDTWCLVFVGAPKSGGHVGMTIGVVGNKRIAYVHQVAWALSGRTVPPGHELMHNCPGGDNPACCNVNHLRTGTRAEHGVDRAHKGQEPKSKSGLPFGVSRRRYGTFQARCKINGKLVILGSYATVEEAAGVARSAWESHHGTKRPW